jgi:hypothetical protein
MPNYLLSIYQPDGAPPPPEKLARIMANVNQVREEMEAAGVLVYTNGLEPAFGAQVVRWDDQVPSVTDGPYAEAKEHIGGLYVINAPDRAAAIDWAKKAARATTLPIEVRAFQ